MFKSDPEDECVLFEVSEYRLEFLSVVTSAQRIPGMNGGRRCVESVENCGVTGAEHMGFAGGAVEQDTLLVPAPDAQGSIGWQTPGPIVHLSLTSITLNLLHVAFDFVFVPRRRSGRADKCQGGHLLQLVH